MHPELARNYLIMVFTPVYPGMLDHVQFRPEYYIHDLEMNHPAYIEVLTMCSWPRNESSSL